MSPVSEPMPVAASQELAFNHLAARDLAASLPGVGEVLAARIVEHRAEHGPFRSAEQLGRVRGMGQRRAARLWALVVSTPPASDPPERVLSELEHLDEPPGWRIDEPPSIELAPWPVSASDLPPPSIEEPPRPMVPPRRRSFRLAAVAVLSLICASLGVGVWLKLADATRARESAEAEALRADVGALRGEVQRVSSAQAQGASVAVSASARLEAVEKRLVEQDQAQERGDKRLTQIEERSKKVEEKLDKQAARIGKAEDDLAWQKLATSAQLANLKRQVKSAADQIEGLAASE